MPTINPVIVLSPAGVVTATWANMANGDVGAPLDAPAYADKTVTVFGTFGAGGTLVIQGRPNTGGAGDAHYTALNDSRGEGNAASFTSLDTRVLNENPHLIRPTVTGGDGTTSLTCVIVGVHR